MCCPASYDGVCDDEFLRCLNLVLHEEVLDIREHIESALEFRYVRQDCGLSRAHQVAYEHVMKLASTELLIGRVPTPE